MAIPGREMYAIPLSPVLTLSPGNIALVAGTARPFMETSPLKLAIAEPGAATSVLDRSIEIARDTNFRIMSLLSFLRMVILNQLLCIVNYFHRENPLLILLHRPIIGASKHLHRKSKVIDTIIFPTAISFGVRTFVRSCGLDLTLKFIPELPIISRAADLNWRASKLVD
jgi:hypothetical protein